MSRKFALVSILACAGAGAQGQRLQPAHPGGRDEAAAPVRRDRRGRRDADRPWPVAPMRLPTSSGSLSAALVRWLAVVAAALLLALSHSMLPL